MRVISSCRRVEFQSTRPRGARPPYTGRHDGQHCFNPRAREGRDLLLQLGLLCKACFNPRAREGRDTGEILMFRTYQVSIHAPARGATRVACWSCDADPVSIHAPARGATWRALINWEALRCFNPRAREGRDLRGWVCACWSLLFQSTRPRGARPAARQTDHPAARFNPRAREGRDWANRGFP